MSRGFACLLMLLSAATFLVAQEPQEETIKLTVRPAAAPAPALKYRLLPELREQTPGNAALLYYRAFSPEWSAHRRPEVAQKLNVWYEDNSKPPDKDLRWVVGYPALREIDRAARREYCDWEVTTRAREEGFALALPDIQSFREFANLLRLRARFEMADGRYDQAVRTLETGFAFGRHIGDGPTLIHGLVGIAISTIMCAELEQLIQAPGAPNLYWSLTDLPRPFIDLRKGFQGDQLWVEAHLPELKHAQNRPLSSAEVQAIMDRLPKLFAMAGTGEVNQFEVLLAGTALIIKAYPDAKKFLLAQGKTPEQVEAMPALQAVLLYSLDEYETLYDEMYKWHSLPFWEAQAGMAQWEQQLKAAKVRTDRLPFAPLLLPAVHKVTLARARLDRRIAALRCVEAIRLYAAAHDGKLPGALDDIKEVPIPIDPVTGKSFEYKLEGDKVTLRGPAPAGTGGYNALVYELTLKK